MAGTVYLGGGGDAFDEEILWRTMLRGKSRVLYWPFALPAQKVPNATDWLNKSFKQLGLTTQIEMWPTLVGHEPAELAEADLLFVGGGNTFQLAKHVKEHDFENALLQFVANGGDYYGGSAGAVIAGSDIRTAAGMDANDVELADLQGLSLVKNLAVLPHYSERIDSTAQELAAEMGLTILGIPEKSGVMSRAGKFRVIGRADVRAFNATSSISRSPDEDWWSLPKQ